MTRLFVLTLLAVTMAGASTAQAGRHAQARKAQAMWIHTWTRSDQSIWPAIDKASSIFGVSDGLMRVIVGREGGNINPRTLKASLCNATQPGWNAQGSYAFGAFQFMLDRKPACGGGWGTFGSYVHSAFASAKKLGHPVPFRFKTPASNVGQAVTAAYMLAHGGLHHWCASMC